MEVSCSFWNFPRSQDISYLLVNLGVWKFFPLPEGGGVPEQDCCSRNKGQVNA